MKLLCYKIIYIYVSNKWLKRNNLKKIVRGINTRKMEHSPYLGTYFDISR